MGAWVRFGGWTWVAAAATGVVSALSAPGVLPWSGASWLAWPAFAPLLAVLPRVGFPRAAALGFVAGLLMHLIAFSWLAGLTARFSGLSPVVAVIVAVGLCAWAAAGWGAAAALVRACRPVLPAALAAPAAWVVVERWWPAVFPWSMGVTQYRNLLPAQAAELGGPVVVTFLIVLVSAVVAETWRWRRGGRGMPWRAWAGGGAVLAAALVFGAVRFAQVDAERSAAPVVRVGVVQAGVMQSGWTGRPADADLAARYRRVSERLEAVAGRLDLLVWPEKATNGVFRRDPRRDAPLGRARRIRGRFTSPLLFGATAVDPDTREAYNSALLLEHDGRLSVVYDKIRLIFYSEHLPGWLDRIGDSASRYRAGTRRDPIRLSVGGESVAVGVFICFEAAFPAHVRALAAHGAELWVNLSDDSWFADTSEPEQHLAAAVFRAIESRRDVVRAAGSGVSAWITAGGEIALRTALNASPDDAEVGVVVAPRRLRAPGLHAAAGDLFAVWCLAAIVTGVVVIGVRRRRRRRIPPTSSGLAPGGDSDTLVP